jgi:hypothetical protein
MAERSKNTRVMSAYYDGKYTDAKGNEWRRGMDGWFLDDVDGKGGVMLARHHDFVELVETENPELTYRPNEVKPDDGYTDPVLKEQDHNANGN